VTSSFDERLDQLERALKVIGPITDNKELQESAFAWLVDERAVSSHIAPAPPPATPAAAAVGANGASDGGSAGKGKRSSKPANVSPDKSVDLTPASGSPWTDYAAEKAPTNLNDKYSVAVYWLQEIADGAPVTIAKLVYLFIAAKWNIPADVKNKASVAGVAGLIDTADLQNITITGLGTARVLNQLPPKK